MSYLMQCTIVLGMTLVMTSIAIAVEQAAVPPSAQPNKSVAVESIDDSLQACLARIPKDATAGQRMIAEQSCRRDERDRQPFQAGGRY
jgi:hypothetical protein